jgi:prophage antirepressor-like protein
MPNLIAFSYQDAPLRVETDTDGEPLFHAGDLCAILGYANPRDAVRRHVDAEDVVKRDTLSAGGLQEATWVREPGLWSLILGSETAAARPVKRWVTAEVLPSIRKTGGYAITGANLAAEVAQLRGQVERLSRLLPSVKRRTQYDVIRDKVAAYLAKHRPALINPDIIAAEILHKRTLSPAEHAAVMAGFRQMGYKDWRR